MRHHARVHLMLLALLAALLPFPCHARQASPLYGKRLAICIGNNRYDPIGAKKGWWTGDHLRLPENDAQKVALALDAYGFRADAVDLLIGPEATREAITAAFDKRLKSLGPDDVLIVFYSGHGVSREFKVPGKVTRSEGYLVPAGAITPPASETAEAYDASLVSMSKLASDIRSLKENQGRHVLLLLDCCFSGLAVEARGATKEKVRLYRHMALNPSRLVITAGMGDQLSFEPPAPERKGKDEDKDEDKDQHGYFTQALINSLQKRAKVNDPFCATELYNSVREEMVSLLIASNTGVEMDPQMRPLRMEPGEIVFVPSSAPPEVELSLVTREADPATTNPSTTPTAAQPPVGKGVKQSPADDATAPTSQQELEDVVKDAEVAAQSTDGRDLSTDPAWVARYNTYNRRASAGDENAMAILHVMTLRGLGTRRDETKAYRWASESSDLNNDFGKLFLANCYRQGIHVDKNPGVAQDLSRDLPQHMQAMFSKMLSGEKASVLEFFRVPGGFGGGNAGAGGQGGDGGNDGGAAKPPKSPLDGGDGTAFGRQFNDWFRGDPKTVNDVLKRIEETGRRLRSRFEEVERTKAWEGSGLTELAVSWRQEVQKLVDFAKDTPKEQELTAPIAVFKAELKKLSDAVKDNRPKGTRSALDAAGEKLADIKRILGAPPPPK